MVDGPEVGITTTVNETLSFLVTDEFGCTGEGSAIFKQAIEGLPTEFGHFGLIQHRNFHGQDVDSELFNEFEDVLFEFKGCQSCGWIDDGFTSHFPCTRVDPGDWNRAKFTPANDTEIGDDKSEECWKGGVVRIDATISMPGPDYHIIREVVIPPNSNSFYLETGDYNGCVFPRVLFDYPTIMYPSEILNTALLYADLNTTEIYDSYIPPYSVVWTSTAEDDPEDPDDPGNLTPEESCAGGTYELAGPNPDELDLDGCPTLEAYCDDELLDFIGSGGVSRCKCASVSATQQTDPDFINYLL